MTLGFQLLRLADRPAIGISSMVDWALKIIYYSTSTTTSYL